MTSGPIEVERKKLRVRDIDLPLLASQAAIELDNLLTDDGHSVNAVSKLASRLRESFEVSRENTDGPKRLHVDSGTFTVFSDALSESRWNGGARTVDEVVEEGWDVMKKLDEVLSSPVEASSRLLQKTRDFCLALSSLAASYRQSIYEANPTHPHKK